MKTEKFFYLVYLVLGFVFLKSSWEKIEGGKFVSSLGGTLGKFASQNPFPFFKSFLLSVAIPNSLTFGYLTMVGEFLTGLAYAGSALVLLLNKKVSKIWYLLFSLGCLGGVILNGVFWLAAGYTSSSTDSLNLIMALLGLIGLIFGIMKLTGGKE